MIPTNMPFSNQDVNVVAQEIDDKKEFLNEISQNIWKNPELSFKEFYAHKLLTETLENFGFSVQREYILPTAFKAEFKSKSDVGSGPTVAVCLEYDALPGIGHACGHNLIAEVGIAATLAIKAAMMADSCIPGKLVVLGCPAEEGGGGKIKLIAGGAFKNIDAAIMAHPSKDSMLCAPLSCAAFMTVDFHGKSAHAGAFPHEGHNALDAAVACYQSLGLLRQQLKPNNKISVIITNGGKAVNIIPDLTSMSINMRTAKRSELKTLLPRVEACIRGAAVSSSCTADIQFDANSVYHDLMSNRTLANVFEHYGDLLGIEYDDYSMADRGAPSSDMGNVSYVVPALQPEFAIPTSARNHTAEFCEAAGSDSAQEPTLRVAKAMALTVLQVLRNDAVLQDIKKEFERELAKEG